MLDAIDQLWMRQGAIEALACLVEQMGMSIIPYIVLLVIPVLGRMSDTNEPVRLVATQSFATLIRLMPLEGGVPDPPALSPQLIDKKLQQRHFLEQLFNPKKLDSYQVWSLVTRLLVFFFDISHFNLSLCKIILFLRASLYL